MSFEFLDGHNIKGEDVNCALMCALWYEHYESYFVVEKYSENISNKKPIHNVWAYIFVKNYKGDYLQVIEDINICWTFDLTDPPNKEFCQVNPIRATVFPFTVDGKLLDV